MQNLADDTVQQITIVRDDQHSASISRQEALKPGQPLEVQVVGRLVQQQQLRLRKQSPYKREHVLLTARQRADQLFAATRQPQ